MSAFPLFFVSVIAAQMAAAPLKPIERENWLSPDDVPIEVLRKRKGGVVGYELQVGGNGKPTSCQITETSGLPALDQATCSALMERATFQPARDSEGKTVASAYRSEATFEPPVVDAKAHEGPRLTITRLTLNPDGSLVECGQEGDNPEPISVKECEKILQSERGAFFKQMAATHGVFRVANAWTPPMYKARPALSSWGERLAYRVDQEILNSRKLTFSCYTSHADGRVDLLGEGCVNMEKASKSDIRRGHPGIIIRWERAIFAVKR